MHVHWNQGSDRDCKRRFVDTLMRIYDCIFRSLSVNHQVRGFWEKHLCMVDVHGFSGFDFRMVFFESCLLDSFRLLKARREWRRIPICGMAQSVPWWHWLKRILGQGHVRIRWTGCCCSHVALSINLDWELGKYLRYLKVLDDARATIVHDFIVSRRSVFSWTSQCYATCKPCSDVPSGNLT